MIYENVFELIGQTPLIKLNKLMNKYNTKNNLFAKKESNNPGGSIKDRVAKEMIDDALKKGVINKDTTVVEATSGNTGIGLAMVCAYYDIKLIVIMCESVTKERISLIESYGSTVILTKASDGILGAIKKAKELCINNDNYYYINQFDNEQNSMAHYTTTAVELIKDLNRSIDYVFIGMGSTGTICGIGKKLKEFDKDIKIIGIEPLNCAYYKEGKTGKYDIPGIGTTFLPKIYNKNIIDDIIEVEDEKAKFYMQEIIKTEGLSVGYSSGACFSGALEYIANHNINNKNIVLIFPDGFEKYLSKISKNEQN